MIPFIVFIVALGISSIAFFMMNKKMLLLRVSKSIHSLPREYGYLSALISISPFFIFFIFALFAKIFSIHIETEALLFICFLFSIFSIFYSMKNINAKTKARDILEKVIEYSLYIGALISVLVTFAIIFSILIEAIEFFKLQDFWYFLTGLEWSPDESFLEGSGLQESNNSLSKFGSVPLVFGTIMITIIAMFIAIIFGVSSAIYLSEYATCNIRSKLKPLIEILAGIPTVVYGFFAAITVAPAFVNFFSYLGFEVSYNNALASGVIMGVMITPIVMSLSEDSLRSVPDNIRQASYGLGMLKSETIMHIVLPMAMPGIISSIVLGISRAVGETMIVVMAAGLRPNISLNPLEDMTTMTVRIVDALTGDQEFGSSQTLSVFALGLLLFIFTMSLNWASLYISRKFNKKYKV